MATLKELMTDIDAANHPPNGTPADDIQAQLELTLDWMTIRTLAGAALDREATRLRVLLDARAAFAPDEISAKLAAELTAMERRLALVKSWRSHTPPPGAAR